MNPPTNRTTPFLLGQVGTLAGERIFIDGARAIIGRNPTQCQIVLAQPVISRRHAMIELDARGGAMITDLGSSEGTFVNGQRVERSELREGDLVGFGTNGLIGFTFHTNASQPVASTPYPAPSRPPVADPTAHFNAANISALRIGRAPDNEIVLDAPGVSRYHATLAWNDDSQPTLADAGSTNGTFVNGELLTEPRLVTPDDLALIGGFLLRVNGRRIEHHDLSASRITAHQISKDVPGKRLLHDISLAIFPREFVGLMGPSGCGKSTLMDTLNGLRPATSGAVYINDLDLYRNFDALRRSIGYVPQHDILHESLSVERTLFYAAKMRLPEATPLAELQRVVDEVIETVGLGEQRSTPFRLLSGGQQKRLSLGFELVTKPGFLFLDEPTSPLDPETTENMMLLFRRLADQGRIVVMVTHKFEKFEEMSHIAFLTRGGYLAFFGPPREALVYFGCREPSDIYRIIGASEPEDLSRAFQASPQYQRYVSGRIAETRQMLQSTGNLRPETPEGSKGPGRGFGLRQWSTLTRRYLEVKLNDKRNTALLLLQSPVVAIILVIIAGDSRNDAKTLFIAAVIAIWFGANNAVREIVAEAPIYTRERLVNLKIPSYVFSKFTVLSGIGLLQCLMFVAILVGFGCVHAGDFFHLTLIIYLTSLGGVAMGLFFSALVNSTEKAMSVLPLLLIPQLLLGGFLKPLDDLYVNVSRAKPATAARYRSFESSKNQSPREIPSTVPEPVTKYEGLGPARVAAAAMIARWSIEALAHQVSIDDEKARDALATRMTVVEYEKVLDQRPPAEITDAYRSRVRIDLIALGGFGVLFLGLTMWAQKRKDAW